MQVAIEEGVNFVRRLQETGEHSQMLSDEMDNPRVFWSETIAFFGVFLTRGMALRIAIQLGMTDMVEAAMNEEDHWPTADPVDWDAAVQWFCVDLPAMIEDRRSDIYPPDTRADFDRAGTLHRANPAHDA